MAFTPDDIQANAAYFRAKLRAETQKAAVVEWQKGKYAGDFVLVDTRPRDGFAKLHIEGAINVPLAELDELIAKLPKDRELVLYCWNHS